MKLLLSYLVLCALVSWYALDLDTDEERLSLLLKKINVYRWIAEQSGRKVIELEAKYYALAEQGRMN